MVSLVGRHGLQGAQASVVAVFGLSNCGFQAIEHRLNSYGTWAQLLPGIWDLPGSGIKPVSSALEGGFFTTEPPAKLVFIFFFFLSQDRLTFGDLI